MSFLGAWRMHWAVENVQYILWAVVVLGISVLQWGGCRCTASVCVFTINIGSTDFARCFLCNYWNTPFVLFHRRSQFDLALQRSGISLGDQIGSSD